MKSSGSLDLPVHEATEDSDRRPYAGAIAWLLRLARDSARVTRASRASARTTLERQEPGDPETASDSAPLPSEQPRYVDICEISHGGMGRVRLVRDTTLLREPSAARSASCSVSARATSSARRRWS
jgi:hypothetical protein